MYIPGTFSWIRKIVCLLVLSHEAFGMFFDTEELNVVQTCERNLCFPRVIWSHWSSDLLPEDVEEMVTISRISLTNFSHLLLTPANLSEYLDTESFPSGYYDLTLPGKSDYVRVCLGAKFGGIYVDSTTFINSGSEMEWFIAEALKTQSHLIAFINNKTGKPFFRSSFFGASKNCVFMKEYKKKYDDALGKNITEYSIRLCRELVKETPPFSHCASIKPRAGSHPPYYYLVYYVMEKLIRDNRQLKEGVLILPENRSHVRLATECEHYSGGNTCVCIRNRLLYDRVARSYPFIKVWGRARTGKEFNLRKQIDNTMVPVDGTWTKMKKVGEIGTNGSQKKKKNPDQ